MIVRKLMVVLLAGSAALAASACDDDEGPTVERFAATLIGGSEVPPVTTTATGTALIEFTTTGLQYTVNVSGITNVTLAHIHGPAAVGVNANPILNLNPNTSVTTGVLATGTVTGTTSQTVSMVVGILWGYVFPINKALWTSSYVIFTAGMACQFLAMCYFLIDVKGYRWWTKPFVVFGMNAIAAFFLSSVGARTLNLIKVAGPDGAPIALKTFIFRNAYVPFFSPLNASLAYAITYVLFWLAILWVMYNRRIFIKL